MEGIPAAHGSFRAQVVALLDASKAPEGNHAARKDAPLPAPLTRDEVDCSLAPMLVKFLRPEVAIMGADLRGYGSFRQGDVAAIPFLHAAIFIDNGAAEMFGG